MKAEIIQIHSDNTQKRLISHIVNIIISGGVIVIPTDSGFSIATSLDNKTGIDRIRKIRKLSKRHDFTLMLESFSHIGEFAKMNNDAFRLMKRVLPGAYTFILEATRQVPNRLVHPKKKTIGIRISSNTIVQDILQELSHPIISVSLIIEGYEFLNTEDVVEALENKVDVIIDSSYCPPVPTSVIDFTKNPYQILRKGAGDTSLILE